MLKKWHIHRLSIVVIILFTMFLVFYTAKDAAAFDGGALISDIEMEETVAGGFMNGNFVYFSMDFMGPSSSIGNLTGFMGNHHGLGGITKDIDLNLNVADNFGLTTVGVIIGNNNYLDLGVTLNLNLSTIQVANHHQMTRLIDQLHLLF